MLKVYDSVLFTFSSGRHCMLQYSKAAEPHSVFTRQYILIFTLSQEPRTLQPDWWRLCQVREIWGLIGLFCQVGRIFQPRRLSIQTLMEIKSMKIILFSWVDWFIFNWPSQPPASPNHKSNQDQYQLRLLSSCHSTLSCLELATCTGVSLASSPEGLLPQISFTSSLLPA